MPDALYSDSSTARPTGTYKGYYQLSTISLMLLLASLCVPSGVMYFITAPAGWLCALVAVLVGVGKLWGRLRNTDAWKGLALAILVLVVQTRFYSQVFWLWARAVDGRPVSAANMSLLGKALRQYADQNGDYPRSFSDLTRSELTNPKWLVSPYDPGLDWGTTSLDRPEATYSSYVYQPGRGTWGSDPKLVLAYEYGAWHPTDFQLFPTCGQLVLFGDGRVELLEGVAFTKALRDDAVRRCELGWPTDKIRPVGDTLPAKHAATQSSSAASP